MTVGRIMNRGVDFLEVIAHLAREDAYELLALEGLPMFHLDVFQSLFRLGQNAGSHRAVLRYQHLAAIIDELAGRQIRGSQERESFLIQGMLHDGM
jgi:hypothetical protein